MVPHGRGGGSGIPWRAMLCHGRGGDQVSHGGPCSVMAAGGSGIPWRAMLCHGRFFSGHRARQTVRPKGGRDRARPSNEDLHGGPWSLVAAGGGIRYPMEGHAPSWPPLLRTPCQANREAQRRTRQSASLQGRSPWRAMVPHGRGRIRYPMEGHAPSWPQGG